MTLLRQLLKKPIKKEPDVWVKRLVLFEKLEPKPVAIRDIALHRGLNIVLAREPESTADHRDIAGHSAGKTTFCRLVRYVLGEKTFASRSATQAIKKSFPNGYVAAEIMIKGQLWAVLRPLGENRNSWIMCGGTIDAIAIGKGEPAYQNTYPMQLGLDALVHGLSSAMVVRTREEIKWDHLLAWCTRDQEARFQNIYEWRSARSQSEWPAFQFPKADPLFVMRVVLGLYLPGELKAEETLAGHIRDLERAEDSFEFLKQEPKYWRDHHHARLKKALKERFPADAAAIDAAPLVSDELLPDLKRYVQKAKYLSDDELTDLRTKLDAQQVRINEANVAIAEAQGVQRYFGAQLELNGKAATEIESVLDRVNKIRQRNEQHKDTLCPFGDLLIGKCSHVQQIQRGQQPGEVQRTHAAEQMEAERAAERQQAQVQYDQLQEAITAQETARDLLLKAQQQLQEQFRARETVVAALVDDLDEMLSWAARLESPEKIQQLKLVIDTIEDLKGKIEVERTTLNELLANHDDNRDLLNQIFSRAARLVLPSSNYDGVVRFDDRELNFQVTHGGAMSGEAIETLAVLLADFTCLIFNLLSAESHLPGFLLHDSPREADLSLRLYHSFLRFVADFETSFPRQDACPFQYILTTTTPPPAALSDRAHLVLQLDASQESELLFRRNLARPPKEEELDLSDP